MGKVMTIERKTETELIRIQFRTEDRMGFSALKDNTNLFIKSDGEYNNLVRDPVKIVGVIYLEADRNFDISAAACRFIEDNEDGFVMLTFGEYEKMKRPRKILRSRVDTYTPSK